MLLAVVGEQPLKNHYKKDYSKVKQLLYATGIRLSRLKFYYDQVEDKNELAMNKYIKELQNVQLIQYHLYKIFIILLDSSDMKYSLIPTECFIMQMGIGRRTQEMIPRPEEADKHEY